MARNACHPPTRRAKFGFPQVFRYHRQHPRANEKIQKLDSNILIGCVTGLDGRVGETVTSRDRRRVSDVTDVVDSPLSARHVTTASATVKGAASPRKRARATVAHTLLRHYYFAVNTRPQPLIWDENAGRGRPVAFHEDALHVYPGATPPSAKANKRRYLVDLITVFRAVGTDGKGGGGVNLMISTWTRNHNSPVSVV